MPVPWRHAEIQSGWLEGAALVSLVLRLSERLWSLAGDADRWCRGICKSNFKSWLSYLKLCHPDLVP